LITTEAMVAEAPKNKHGASQGIPAGAGEMDL
jgi:hypothetical protein